MKLLILCRHAKSSWKDLSLDDHDRPLNKRGRRNAPVMGQRLGELTGAPQRIVTSPAKRALQTAAALAKELGVGKKSIEICEPLYDASASRVVECIHGLDDDLSSVMLVGHNPEFTILANWLGNLAIENVPTCGMVAFTFEGENWQAVERGNGSLLFFEYPKKLTDN